MSWRYPVDEPVVVTSPFNLNRRHPVTGVWSPHTGADYRAREGAPLYAASDGVVTRSGYAGATAGNYVRIEVPSPRFLWVGYSHLSRRLVDVGDRVGAGQLIGYAGSTGAATGAHLHFEVCVDGTKVDPVPFLAARIPPPAPPAPAPPAPTTKESPVLVIFNTAANLAALVYPSGQWTLVPSGVDAQRIAASLGSTVADVSDGTFKALTPGPWKLV